MNTYYPPNQPTPRRCYRLGQKIREAVERWDQNGRVAVVASGGLSHFVIDQELDASVLRGIEKGDTELLNIVEDPSFFILAQAVRDPVYPWEEFRFSENGDTAIVNLQGAAPDARIHHEIYAHLHMMKKMDRLDEWLPDSPGLEGYQLERAILVRVSDAWLYGRTIFDLAPYAPLDELIFANENGYLDAFILTARADEFRAERRTWLDENPNATQEYRAWFREIFERDPKGLR